MNTLASRATNLYRSTFGMAALGSVLLWAALPSMDLWLLAWLAPIPWVALIQRPKLTMLDISAPLLNHWWLNRWWLGLMLVLWLLLALPLSGYFHSFAFHGYAAAEAIYWPVGLALFFGLAAVNRSRPYLTLWLVGFCFWLAVLQWLRLPHWATGIGWWALACYFAFYLPAFVALARLAVHRWRVPAVIAAPVVWTGLEWARAHLLTGMTMGSLGHTQYHWTRLIQISDLVGAYGVSFLVVFVAACVERLLPMDGRTRVRWPAALAVAALVVVLAYGQFRIGSTVADPGPRVALIQGSFDISLEPTPGLAQQIQADYWKRTKKAVDGDRQIELVIWPETIFSPNWMTSSEHPPRPAILSGVTDAEFPSWLDSWVRGSRQELLDAAQKLGVPMIVGIDRQHIGETGAEFFNTAVFVQPGSREIAWYDKTHLVMFGEYMPLVDRLPWLQNFTPLCISSHEGDHPVAFLLHYGAGDRRRAVNIAPNICYESVLPHLIREQVVTLRAAGHDPDILVNLTNDGWFWGSNELELHLACGVFRAVECRRPFLISANTGISASIDSCGRLRGIGPQRDSTTIVADVTLDHRRSLYVAWGDCFAAGCLIAALASAALARLLKRT